MISLEYDYFRFYLTVLTEKRLISVCKGIVPMLWNFKR